MAKSAISKLPDYEDLQRQFPTIRRPAQVRFLAAYVVSGNIMASANFAEIIAQTHYNWLKSDPEYAECFEQAQKLSLQVLESEARRRAIEGTRRLKFHQGKPIIDPDTGQPYIEHVYSDALLMFLLRANAPEKYARPTDDPLGGGRITVNVNAPGSTFGNVVDDERRAELDRYYEMFNRGADARRIEAKEVGPEKGNGKAKKGENGKGNGHGSAEGEAA